MESMPATQVKKQLGFATAFIALVIGAIGMGASPIFVRFAASDVGPFSSAFWRVALALPFLYGWMSMQEKQFTHYQAKRKLSKFSILAGVAFTGDLFFWHLSILNTSIANATFFATLTPVFVMLFTYFFLRKVIQRLVLVGMTCCLIGGGVLIGGTVSVAPQYLKGDFFGLVTALFFSFYFLSVGVARQEGISPARITFIQTFVTATCLFFIAMIHSFLTGVDFFPKTTEGLMALLGLALVSQVIGQGLLVVSLGVLPTVFTSLVIFLEIVVAAILGWLILNEKIYLAQYIGGGCILVGIWIARPKGKNTDTKGMGID